jgi:hydroxylamine reductase (hybrid-cluster protein)
MAILLAMSLGLSAILFSQIKMIREIGNSVISFYAADTGIEWLLYKDRECRLLAPSCDKYICSSDCENLLDRTFPESSVGKASYIATVKDSGATFRSQGNYKGTKRAIEINR